MWKIIVWHVSASTHCSVLEVSSAMRLLHKLIFSLLRGLTCVRDMLRMLNTLMHWLMIWHSGGRFSGLSAMWVRV